MAKDPKDTADRITDRMLQGARQAAERMWKCRLGEHTAALFETRSMVSLEDVIGSVKAAMVGKSEQSLAFIENAPVLAHLEALRDIRK